MPDASLIFPFLKSMTFFGTVWTWRRGDGVSMSTHHCMCVVTGCRIRGHAVRDKMSEVGRHTTPRLCHAQHRRRVVPQTL